MFMPVLVGGGGSTGVARDDNLLTTIETIHAAGLDAELWPKALEASARIVGGNAATIELFDKRTLRHLEMHSFGLPAAEEIAYLDHYAAFNVRLPFVSRQRLGEMSWDHMILDERAMARSPFYADFMPRMDVRYFVSGIVAKTDRIFAGFCVHRSPKQGHIGRQGIATMARLVPHVQQAFDVARRLRGAREAQHSFERALDWLADGVALLAADGQVTYANQALQAMARRNDGIQIRNSRIEFTAAAARDRLDAVAAEVRRAHKAETAMPLNADFAAARANGAPPYIVSVRPIAGGENRNPSMTRAVVIVFVHDPSGRHGAAIRLLRDVFGFTEVEASIAQALQRGVPLGEYARGRLVSLNTVYTHLRRIKEKIGCHRMAELIRKLNDVQAPLRED